MIPLPLVKQATLWQDNCIQKCDMYDVCEGAASAPCGCVKTISSERYDCENCDVLCLERHSPGFSITQQLNEGSALSEVQLEQCVQHHFPLLIPHTTHESAHVLPVAWAGVDLSVMLNETRTSPSRVSKLLRDTQPVRGRLKVEPYTKLIGVLNAQDWLLEGFWGMSRSKLYEALEKHGFSVVTGPTFSITHETTGFPASHNVLMSRRHHRVMRETQETNLLAVPNIYWRNERGMDEWVEWLNDQDHIYCVSRDFSLTKSESAFKKEWGKFMDLLTRLEQRLHVLLVGVGSVNGLVALQELASIGCTASIITSNPIQKAISEGCRIERKDDDRLTHWQDRSVPRQELILSNIDVVEDFLVDHASKFQVYQGAENSLRNFSGQ